jgi:hypothetical protein
VLGPTPAHQPLYYLTKTGAAWVIRGPPGPDGAGQPAAALPAAALPGQLGTGRIPLRTLAVSPDQRYLAGIAGSSVYTADLTAPTANAANRSAGTLSARLTGGSFTSISWDRTDDLWVAGKLDGQSGVWVVPPGAAQPIKVSLPAKLGAVTALRVASDGVRVAMIVGRGPEARLLLGAIVNYLGQKSIEQTVAVGADVSAPSALTWYGADYLLVVAQSAAGTTLEEVPADGGPSSAVEGSPDMVSITAAGLLNPLYASLDGNHLARSIGLGELWSEFAPGSSATYPG